MEEYSARHEILMKCVKLPHFLFLCNSIPHMIKKEKLHKKCNFLF